VFTDPHLLDNNSNAFMMMKGRNELLMGRGLSILVGLFL
jgi:hypothetical protein